MNKKKSLVWIDLEMTGLDATHDVILEIATIITDDNLNVIHEAPAMIIHQPESVLNGMNEWCREQHCKSGLTEKVCASTLTLKDAEDATLAILQQYCEKDVSPLCGNSIWQDRTFLKAYMPRILDFLHYRMIDVSTIKELIRRWYPENVHAEYVKKDAHRALDDIHESIAELAHYRKYFFIP